LAFFVEANLEIVGFSPPTLLVSRSSGRIRSETAWSLAPVEGGTLVRFTGDYQLPVALRIVGDRAVETLVSSQVQKSLQNLIRLFAATG
jgi:hypothetical protein